MSAHARRWLAALAALWATLALAQGEGLPADDWRTIRSIVEAQRAALVARDGARAFAYASPAIREQFGNARTFMAMVEQGYAELLDAREAVTLDGAVIDGQVIQPIRLVMPDDTVYIALYTMEKQRGGAWRISGCVIAPSTLRST